MCEIIRKHPGKSVLVCVDSVGKEELMQALAIEFKTKVIVNRKKYQMIEKLNMNMNYFSMDPEDGWIEVIRKDTRWDRMYTKINFLGRIPNIFRLQRRDGLMQNPTKPTTNETSLCHTLYIQIIMNCINS